ncbi:NAD(P)H-dependent oxidoreductase [Cognatishimia sp. SS12]|uniref:NAD(P)H-dependent oxidoreductase n=1 Tax=Cognatishimia sp. SS12 TaxID=2979465 RepID=UPI00232E46B7|nr:NAD(P)H-dependent oxidoreductase [Cognatishimia sp. SS12]MDC0738247.1 NAD(P)H-dependent oxidoreductase [Cognatishimia sp. SS12]
MTRKRIFVLDGHPAEASLARSFAEAYAARATAAGHEVRLMHLHALNFDLDFEYGSYRQIKPLEPDLQTFVQNLEWCEHLVLTTPMWWGGLPAKLKGLIDRSFLPGQMFDTRGKLPKPMLGGRTARVILTSDSPGWYFRFFLKNALKWQLRRQVLGFIGLKTKITAFAQASHPKDGQVERWQRQVADLGARAA